MKLFSKWFGYEKPANEKVIQEIPDSFNFLTKYLNVNRKPESELTVMGHLLVAVVELGKQNIELKNRIIELENRVFEL